MSNSNEIFINQKYETKSNILYNCEEKNIHIDLLDTKKMEKEKKEKKEKNIKIWEKPKNNKKNDIKIYDNILSTDIIKSIQHFCDNVPFEINHRSIDPNKVLKFKKQQLYKNIDNRWSSSIFLNFQKCDVYNNDFFYNLFYDKILPFLDCINNKKNILIDRMYLNTHIHGNIGLFHKDGKSIFIDDDDYRKNAPSVLLYINNNWNINYDGSTCFMLDDNDDKNIYHIEIKQGRIVVFPSYISHKACDTNIYSHVNNISRYVIAFHLIYNKINYA